MCVGCYDIPLTTLISLDSVVSSATSVPLLATSNLQINRPQMSTAAVRAEIVAMLQRLPETPEIQMLSTSLSAIHQRLEGITRSEHVNAIVSEGILSIADHLNSNNANYIIKMLPKTLEPDIQRQTAHSLLQGQQTWEWLS